MDPLSTLETILFIIKAICFAFGIYGNFSLIAVYRKKNLKDRFNGLMLLLSSCAMTCLSLHLVCFVCSFFIKTTSTPYLTLVFLSESPFRGIIFSTVAVATERYLVFCLDKHTDKYPFSWTLGLIGGLAVILSLPQPYWNKSNNVYYTTTMIFNFICVGVIPSVVLIFVNKELYQKLSVCKSELKSTKLSSQKTKEAIKKSIFRARLSILIALTFVLCQTLYWIPRLATAWAPDDDSALYKLVEATAFLVCTIYCSINYYVYQFVTWREKKTTRKSNDVEMSTSRRMSQTSRTRVSMLHSVSAS